MIDVGVVGGSTQTRAVVNPRGVLVTGPLAFSSFYTATTTTNNVAVNLVEPKAGYDFILTGIILAGDRNVGVNGAVTEVFENEIGPTDTTITKSIYIDEIAKQTRAVLTGLNIIITSGRWINVVSDDVQVRANIGGYYVRTI